MLSVYDFILYTYWPTSKVLDPILKKKKKILDPTLSKFLFYTLWLAFPSHLLFLKALVFFYCPPWWFCVSEIICYCVIWIDNLWLRGVKYMAIILQNWICLLIHTLHVEKRPVDCIVQDSFHRMFLYHSCLLIYLEEYNMWN